ncbi:MAG: hypothetical protein ACF8NJ_07795 [Phycisphaerales bacterium JB038]
MGDYDREIASVEAMIEAEIESREAFGPDRSSELLLKSLETRLANLRQARESLRDDVLPGHELDVVFSGAPVQDDRIQAAFLGKALQSLQSLVYALTSQVLGHRRPTGVWPENVLQRSTLQVAETFPGSFGVKLEALDQQLDIEGELAIQPALEDLFAVIGSETTGRDFLAELGPIGPRARSHLRAFVEHVAKSEAEVRLRWPRTDGQWEAKLSPTRAHDLADLLQRIEEEDRLQTEVGRLEGAIIRTRYFELILDDERIISGRVSPDTQADIADFFGHRVEATLLVTKVTDRGTGTEKETYRLLELREAPDVT